MAFTDGVYVARLKLNRLDQVYPAGSLVPGSAFVNDDQVIEYVRRGWIDVDSTGSGGSGGGGFLPRPEFASFLAESATVASQTTLDDSSFVISARDASDSFLGSGFEAFTEDWIQPPGGSGLCRLALGLYYMRFYLYFDAIPDLVEIFHVGNQYMWKRSLGESPASQSLNAHFNYPVYDIDDSATYQPFAPSVKFTGGGATQLTYIEINISPVILTS